MDPQIAVLETKIAHIQTDVAEIKQGQLRLIDKLDAFIGDVNRRFEDLNKEISGRFEGVNKEMNGRFEGVNKEISGLKTAIESTKVWVLTTMFGTFGGVLTLIAHAFKWI